MGRYDFSSASAFQLDVALDLLLIATLALLMAAAIGLWLVQRVFGRDADPVFVGLIAPAFGFAVLIALMDWPARVFGLTASLVISLLCAGATGLGPCINLWRRGLALRSRRPLFIALTGAGLLTLPPLFFLFPWFDGDALYFGRGIYDHIKTAIIDAIAREGMPPRTPYLSLDGAAVQLNYYYGWHLLSAVFRMLPGVSSLGVDLGLTVATAVATFTTVCAVAWRLRPEISTLFATLLLCAGTSMTPVVEAVLPAGLVGVFLSKVHPILTPINQASWVPQHLASGLFVVLALIVTGAASDAPQERRWARGAVLGVLGAAAVMSSAWVGGVFLLVVLLIGLPFLLGLKVYRAPILAAAPVILCAVGVALALASGYLLHLRALSREAVHAASYIGVDAYPTSTHVPRQGLGAVFNILNFITVYAAVHLGALYPAGLIGLYRSSWERQPQPQGLPGFTRLARVIVPAALLAACTMRSTLVHNDFSWRGVLIPVLILLMFAGPTLGALFDRVRAEWPQRGLATRPAGALVAAGIAMIAALWSTRFHFSHYVLPEAASPLRVQHRTMLDAGKAWARVQALTSPGAITMASPAAFAAVSLPPGNLPWALFGDRRLLVTDYEWGVIFAHHVDEARVDALDKLQRRIFASGGSAADLADLAGKHGVSAILVAPTDPVLGTQALAAGGHYHLAERIAGFEVHVRRQPQRP